MLSREQALKYVGQEAMKACYVDDDVVQCAKRFADSEEFQAVKEVLKKYHVIPSHSSLLDIGAGNGIASWAFANWGFTVEAVEPEASPLVGYQAINKLSDITATPIKIHKTWGEILPVDDNSFDVVYCRAVLHHAYDLVQMSKEIWRVLKPNGIFIACREHVLSKPEDLVTFLNSHPLHRFTGEEHAYLLKDYLSAFHCAGFDMLQVFSPRQSPINLYPITKEEMKKKITLFGQSHFGSFVGVCLVRPVCFNSFMSAGMT